jgi:hypothetical protein
MENVSSCSCGAPPNFSRRALVSVHYSRILIGAEITSTQWGVPLSNPQDVTGHQAVPSSRLEQSWSSNGTYWPSKNIRGVGAAKLKAMECRLLVIACDQARADAERVAIKGGRQFGSKYDLPSGDDKYNGYYGNSAKILAIGQ